MDPLPPGSEVLADADAVAARGAERVLGALLARPADEPLALCLSGGSTPKRLYALLAADPLRGQVPWARLHLYWGDERHVPPDDPASNGRMVREALLDPLARTSGAAIPPANLHPIPTGAGLAADAEAYEAVLRAGARPGEPLFDVVLLGLGEDGHTASLFPGKPEAGEAARWVVAVPEAGQPPPVPRVSLTIPALASTRLTLFLATGEGKRGPLARVVAGEDLPAARAAAASVGAVAWLLDRAAAGA